MENEQKKTIQQNELETLKLIKQSIFGMNKENFSQSTNLIISKFDTNFPISFNTIISQMVYIAFVIKRHDSDIYLNFLNEIEIFEEKNHIESKIIEAFTQFIIKKYSQESYYLLDCLIQRGLLESSIIKNILKTKAFFIHYLSEEELEKLSKSGLSFYEGFMYLISENIDEIKKNNFALHKQLIAEGVNTNEIAKIIRNDEIEKLQEISSQENFDFNQKIEPSLYERCNFVNKENVTLIDYAAFFGSVKCFKHLLMNGANVINTGKYAVASGNEEIIHLCEQNHSSFKKTYSTAIKFHKNDIFKYLYENKLEQINNFNIIIMKCFLYHNYEAFSYLVEEGMKINDDIINESAKIGNLLLIKHFLKENELPKNILIFSAQSGNVELVKYILDKGIDINYKIEYGYTALINASLYGRINLVKFLLDQKGIDINAKNNNNETALFLAAVYGYIEIVKLLLEQKDIDINAKDYNGSTALIKSSQFGKTKIVKLLLEQKGIDINAKDNLEGCTALIAASKNGHPKIVKLLLEQKGINVNAKDNDGKTALNMAYLWDNVEIFKLLKDYANNVH